MTAPALPDKYRFSGNGSPPTVGSVRPSSRLPFPKNTPPAQPKPPITAGNLTQTERNTIRRIKAQERRRKLRDDRKSLY